jgi:fatty acid desaturase
MSTSSAPARPESTHTPRGAELAYRPLSATLPRDLARPARISTLLRYALAEWAVIGAAWAALAWLGTWWAFPLGWLVIAGRLHALGVVLHDGCHMRARQRATPLARLLEVVAGYPIATTLAAMRYHHLRHHRFNGTAADPYFKPGISSQTLRRNLRRTLGLMLVPAWIVRGYFGTLALFVSALRNTYAHAFLQERRKVDVSRSAEVLACLRSEPAQALFFTVVLALTARYPQILWYYFTPLVLAGAFNVNRVIVEHVHVECGNRSAAATLATTITHTGAFGRLFLYPRNIGFHQAHHLYPTVALENLPRLNAYLLAQQSRER